MKRLFAASPAVVLVAAVSGVVSAPGVRAQESCGDVDRVDDLRYLRQLTLDLFGRVPTVEEMTPVVEGEDVEGARVEAMLADPEVMTFVRRHHRDLLWPNLDQFQLVNPAIALLIPAIYYEYEAVGGVLTEGSMRLFVLYVGFFGRGGLVPCKDEPAEWDAKGNLVFEDFPDGTKREGWVEVEPYWAPGTKVKVCALEARENLVPEPTLFGGEGLGYYDPNAKCDEFMGMLSGGCGCGPMLEHCSSPDASAAVLESLQAQMERFVERPIEEGRPYFDLLTDAEEPMNGPLVHYYRHLVKMAVDPIIQTPPVPVADLPDVPFTDPTWHLVPRPEPHSGLLTSLMYLLRFQTGRARVNRYYDSFLCAPFQAPELELPSPSDPCSDEPNLRQRCGCNGCHATLEPATAHWARFADAGAMYLDPAEVPAWRAACAGCTPGQTCDFLCERFYLVETTHPKELPWVGTLKSFLWREPEELTRIEAGPRALVEEHLASGALGKCAAIKVFERLHGRAMTPAETSALLPEAVDAFEASGWELLALVRHWVTSDSYRRMVR